MRCSGTNFSSITKVLLPVPASPITCQSSTMVMSLFGTSTEHACLRSPWSITPAAITQSAWSTPLENVMPARPDHAAVDRPALADRRHAVRQLRGRVLAPDVLLRLRRIGRELEDVVGEHHVHPGLRAAAARQRLADFAQHVVAVLEAAVARRLADAQQIVGEIVADRLVRAAAQRFGLRGALLQRPAPAPRRGAAIPRARARWRISWRSVRLQHQFPGLLSFWMRSTTRAGDA